MSLKLCFELTAFLVGLLVGSFLNVCIARLPEHRSIVRPRSHCLRCGRPVRWFDNLPLLSWIVLRGRCRDCAAPIPWSYPLVELATALWFARTLGLGVFLAYSRVSLAPAAGGGWIALSRLAVAELGIAILGFLLIGLMVMDWKTQRLPDAFTLPGMAIGFVLTCVQAAFLAPGEGDVALDSAHQLRMSSPGSFTAQGNVFLTGAESMVLGRLAAVAAAALLLLLVRWGYRAARGREGLGLGDVKLLAMIASFLGLAPALVALAAGVLFATVYAVFLMASRRATPETRLPFGSFIAAGGLLAARFGPALAAWYLSFYR